MADKMIEVIAKTEGQKPNGDWVAKGETFEIEEHMASRLWMARADGKPWPPKEGSVKATADTTELDALRQKNADLEARLAAAEEANDGSTIAALNDRIADLEDQLAKAQASLAGDDEKTRQSGGTKAK